MKSTRAIIAATIAAAAVAGSVTSVSAAEPFEAELMARQGLMQNFQFNLYTGLGPMVKGTVPYDAQRAKILADNVLALSQVNMMAYWPKGTDNVSLKDRTLALPAIWEPNSKIGERVVALKATAAKLAKNAGGGLDSLKTAFTAAGKACGDCHGDYRQKQD